jgi:hypothetical protein
MPGLMGSVMNSGGLDALPQKPKVSGAGYGARKAMYGYNAAEHWKQQKLNKYHGQLSPDNHPRAFRGASEG